MDVNMDSTRTYSGQKPTELKILQIAHGRIIPMYCSAYSLRCHTLIKNLNNKLISVAGAIFKDDKVYYSEQYRSIILTGLSFLKGNRSLEISISKGKFLRKKYLNRLKEAVNDSEIIIFEGPWQYPLVKDLLKEKVVIYDAHNVEYMLREGNRYQNECKRIEGELLERSDIVLSVTKKDIKSFIEIYDVDEKKLFYAPHEIDKDGTQWRGENSNSIVFIGSVYSANNSALDRIQDMASKNPEFTFEIIGSAKPTKGSKMKNMVFHGVVDDSKKSEIMSRCFLALNPVTEGSGRNLKMVDYLAHGLPILSTPIGVRGFEDYNISDSIVICQPDEFDENIKRLSENRKKIKEMSVNAEKLYNKIIDSENNVDIDGLILQAYYNKKSENAGLR
ncbi:MAG: glycosyltransferase [Thermoplasmataceae archaeon]